mmetsp:Transcript_30601/g.42119  ORF Transcript_30601/g.42119 Transcript_30601/m.42119 type:complete len:1444 (+) Transcript_30601:29-4360(+)
MRSQSMSFSNNGMEVSINVPDTVDVKSAFGSVIDTVISQQDEISNMNVQMQKMAEESAKQQRKVVEWAQKCMEKLEEQNQVLKKQLLESQMQIKNLTYNMQGFVDPMTRSDDVLASDILIEKIIEPPPVITSSLSAAAPVPMFPTEDGAELGAGFNLQVSRENSIRGMSTVKSMAKKAAARDYYYSIGPNVLPSKRRPDKRWRWAIQKVLHLVRSGKVKAGFTRTRLEHSQTVVERLNRIELALFMVPASLSERIESESKKINEDMKTQFQKLETTVEQFAEQAGSEDANLKEKLDHLHDKIADISTNKTMQSKDLTGDEKDGEVEAASNRALESKVQLIEKNVKEMIQLDFARSKMGIEYAVSELQNIERRAGGILRSMSSITNTLPTLAQPETEREEIRYLTEVLRLDTELRAARTEIASVEGSLSGLEGVYRTTEQHIDLLVQHQGHHDRLLGNKAAAVSAELQSMLLSCASLDGLSKQVHKTVLNMKVLSGGLDTIIAQRWEALNGFTRALGELDIMANSLASLQEDVSVISSSAAEITAKQTLLEQREREQQDTHDQEERSLLSGIASMDMMHQRLSMVEDMLLSLKSETQSFAFSTQEMLSRLPKSLVFSDDEAMSEDADSFKSGIHSENPQLIIHDINNSTEAVEGYIPSTVLSRSRPNSSNYEKKISDAGQVYIDRDVTISGPVGSGKNTPTKAVNLIESRGRIRSGSNKKAVVSVPRSRKLTENDSQDDDEYYDDDEGSDHNEDGARGFNSFDDSLVESAISVGAAAGAAASASLSPRFLDRRKGAEDARNANYSDQSRPQLKDDHFRQNKNLHGGESSRPSQKDDHYNRKNRNQSNNRAIQQNQDHHIDSNEREAMNSQNADRGSRPPSSSRSRPVSSQQGMQSHGPVPPIINRDKSKDIHHNNNTQQHAGLKHRDDVHNSHDFGGNHEENNRSDDHHSSSFDARRGTNHFNSKSNVAKKRIPSASNSRPSSAQTRNLSSPVLSASSTHSNPPNPFATTAYSRPSSANRGNPVLDSFDDFHVFESVDHVAPPDFTRIAEHAGLLTSEEDALAALLSTGGTGSRKKKPITDNKILFEEVSNITKHIRNISSKLDDVNRSKIGNEQATALFRTLHKEQRHRERGGHNDLRSVDSLSMDMDKNLHEIAKEMLSMKKEQEAQLAAMRGYLEHAIEFAVNKSMDSADAGKDAIANTRAICLGCGRNSTYKVFPSSSASITRPGSPQPNSFLPSLNSGILPGPDIYRSGFRLPARATSPTHKKSFLLDDNQVRVQGQSAYAPAISFSASQPITGLGESMQDVDLENESTVSPSIKSDTIRGIQPPPASTALPPQHSSSSPGLLGVEKRVASASAGTAAAAGRQGKHGRSSQATGSSQGPAISQGPSQGQEALPMFRKGFPGKKSFRAETAYAPERFDLQQPLQALMPVKPTRVNKLSES